MWVSFSHFLFLFVQSHTFYEATSFNRDISSWNPINCTNVNEMFAIATNFSQDLCRWSPFLTGVAEGSLMFDFTKCPISGDPWSVNNTYGVWPYCYPCAVVAPTACFPNGDILRAAVDTLLIDPANTLLINTYGYPINEWCVKDVKNFTAVFSADRNKRARSFNKDLSKWNMSSATSLEGMFEGSFFNEETTFNGDLSNWDVSKVTSFSWMFAYSKFNGDISSWDVSKAEDMSAMFYRATNFNSDLSGWVTDSLQNLEGAFSGASSFNQNLCGWNLERLWPSSPHNVFLDTACPEQADPQSTNGSMCYSCG